MITHRSGRGIAPFLAVGLAATLIGCSSGGSGTDEGGELEITELNVGILPTPDYAPVQIALDNGYFEDEGLTVNAEIFNPSTGLGPLLNQSRHLQGVNWIQFVTSVNQDVPIVGVAPADVGTPGYAEIMVAEDSPYQSLADLDGKKSATVNTPGNCDLIPLAALAKEGETAQPNFVNLAIPEMPAQLARGGVDAACVPEPTLSSVKAEGGFRSVSDIFSGEYEGFPVTGFSASKAFVEANPNTVAAFQRALAKARTDASDDESVVRDALKEYTEIPEAAIEKMVLPRYVETLTEEDLQQVVDVVRDSGLNPEATLPDGVLQLG